MARFNSDDLSQWHSALEEYEERVKALGGEKLAELNRFMTEELPGSFTERSQGGATAFLSKEELEKVVRWKLARGKWRPRLLSMASALPDGAVRSASSRAFAALPNLEEAVKELASLRGVGPATASAVLAVHSPLIAPFMSDEALLAAVGGAKEYTLKKYLEYARRMGERCQELAAASMGCEEGERRLSVSDMEKALWSTAAEQTLKQKKRGQNEKAAPAKAKGNKGAAGKDMVGKKGRLSEEGRGQGNLSRGQSREEAKPGKRQRKA